MFCITIAKKFVPVINQNSMRKFKNSFKQGNRLLNNDVSYAICNYNIVLRLFSTWFSEVS